MKHVCMGNSVDDANMWAMLISSALGTCKFKMHSTAMRKLKKGRVSEAGMCY